MPGMGGGEPKQEEQTPEGQVAEESDEVSLGRKLLGMDAEPDGDVEGFFTANHAIIPRHSGESKKEALENFVSEQEEKESKKKNPFEDSPYLQDMTKEQREKIQSIKIDASKDNILPGLNLETLQTLGVSDKPVLLKKTIIEKNLKRHPEVNEEDFRDIIGISLYHPEEILPANQDKPAYYNFITRIGDDKNTITLLEIAETKDNYEIVNFHWLNNRQRSQKEKKNR